MIILGIDPGTATTGYGVILKERKKVSVLEYGIIETEKNGSAEKRLLLIHKSIKKIIKRFKPNVVVIEQLFFANNAKTAMRVGQAHGVLLLSAAQTKVEISELPPALVKKTITGNGRADKKSVQKKLRSILGKKVKSLPKKKTHFDDAADALAVALTFILKKEVKKR